MQGELIKIRFECDREGLAGGSPERLWAKRISSDSNEARFELQNSPFYARGVSYLDIVEARESSAGEGDWQYLRTLLPSGHSTYRILIDKGSKEFSQWWDKLEKMGCTYEYSEEGDGRLYAVDVPPGSDIYAVYDVLEDAENRRIWTFQEGHCGHQLRK